MRIGRLLLLASLAAGAYYAPRGMSVLPSGTGGGSSDMLHALQQVQLQSQGAGLGGPPEVSFQQMIDATGSNPNAPAVDFTQMIEASERETPAVEGGGGSELSRGLQALGDAGALQSPILQKMVKDYQRKSDQVRSIRDTAWDAWLNAQRWYLRHRREARLALWALPWAMFLIGLLLFVTSQAGLARGVAGLGYGASRLWLQALSFAMIVIALTTHSNPWPVIPYTLLVPPILWLWGSSYTLHLVDMNFPFWNSTLKGCLAPAFSMGFILAAQRFQGLIPGL